MDYSALKKRVKIIKIKAKIKNLFSGFVDFVSYGLAIFSLFQPTFFPNNKFTFDPKNLFLYLIVIIGILLLCFGIKNIYDKIKESSEITVTRTELHDLINFARYNATESVINFAGDLSWLNSEMDDIADIKREHSGVTFTIYYDKNRAVNTNILETMCAEGIVNAIGYPDDISIKLRGMYIDLYSLNSLRYNPKAYVYQRCDNNADKFIWHEYSGKEKVFTNSVESIVGLLSLLKKPTLRIGFSGINNVGKTALANRCKSLLSSDHNVTLHKDAFYTYNQMNNFDNMCVLFQQLANESVENEQINLFDRTIFDNYQYAFLRAGTTGRINDNLHNLNPFIDKSMTKYDIIYYIKRKNDNFDHDTTYVKKEKRKDLARKFEHYYSNTQGINVKRICVDFDDIDNSLDLLSKEITAEIKELYGKKCTGI